MAIKYETITVSGTVLYCDGCGARGPESAYDNINDTLEQAEMMGWETGSSAFGDDEKDLCVVCLKGAAERKKKQ
jgi:hypothetical protein